MAIEPVRPQETASEQTTKFSAASLQAPQNAGWPEHEPDGEAEFAGAPTVRTMPPPSPQPPQAEATSFFGGPPPAPSTEATSFLGASTPTAAATSFLGGSTPPESTTAVHGPVMVEQTEDGDPEVDADARKKRLRKIGIIAGAAVGVLVALWGLDIFVSSGNVPRGVTVAGVEV